MKDRATTIAILVLYCLAAAVAVTPKTDSKQDSENGGSNSANTKYDYGAGILGSSSNFQENAETEGTNNDIEQKVDADAATSRNAPNDISLSRMKKAVLCNLPVDGTSNSNNDSGSETDPAPFRRLTLDMSAYRIVVDACRSQEYQSSILVKQHFFALFIPSETSSSCPSLAYHLLFDDYDNQLNGRVVVDAYCATKEFESKFAPDETFPTTVYTMENIAKAVDVAASESVQKGAWDLFYNSCFNFAVKLAVALDWDIDNGMLSYISKRLLQHHSTSNIQKAINTATFVKHFFSRGPVVMKTIQAYFGRSSGLDSDFESSIFMGQLKEGGNDPKMQKVLAVFYDELVKFYADSYIRPAKN